MLSLNTQLTAFYWDASRNENCLSVTRMLLQPWLPYITGQSESIVTLSCSIPTINSMDFRSNPFFFFSLGKFTFSVLSLRWACHTTFNRLWKFYGFWTILPPPGILMPKISDIHSYFFQPVTCICGCFVYCLLFRATPVAYGSSRLGVKLELQLPAYATTTATPDPSHICNLHHSPGQCQILNPLSKARDQTHVLMDISRVCYCWASGGTPASCFFKQVYVIGKEPWDFSGAIRETIYWGCCCKSQPLSSQIQQPNKNVSFGHDNNSSMRSLLSQG